MNIDCFKHGKMKKALLQCNKYYLKSHLTCHQKKKEKKIKPKEYNINTCIIVKNTSPSAYASIFFFSTFGHLTKDLPTLPLKAS